MIVRLNESDMKRELEPFAKRVGGTVAEVFAAGLGGDLQWMIEIIIDIKEKADEQ